MTYEYKVYHVKGRLLSLERALNSSGITGWKAINIFETEEGYKIVFEKQK